jgi:hypothetical protein
VFLIRLILKTEWDIQGIEGLSRDQWYFINSNHQFWTDMPVLFKAGGFAYAQYAMDGRITNLLDVTIVYPCGRGGFWYFLCGLIPKVIVRVERYRIPPEFLIGDYLNDHNFRTRFQHWLNEYWKRKDDLIEQNMKQTKSAQEQSSPSY